jgi:hypothetical protein
MQIIDELEVNRRGPYGGGLGHVGFTGSMDMALALRTMVIQTAARDTLYSYNGPDSRREWAVHIQARVMGACVCVFLCVYTEGGSSVVAEGVLVPCQGADGAGRPLSL